MLAHAAQFLQRAESPPQGMVLPTTKMSLSILIHVIKKPISWVILDSVSLAVNTHTPFVRNTLNVSFVQSILVISRLVDFKDQMGLVGCFGFVVGAGSQTQGLIQSKPAPYN